MVKTTFEIEGNLLKEFKKKLIDNNESMKKVLTEFIKRYLKKKD